MTRMPSILRLVLFGLAIPTVIWGQHFRLITEQAGLQGAIATCGVAVADYDRDGDLDIYFVAQDYYDPTDSTTFNHLYRNNGDGTFTDVTVEAGVMSTLSLTAWDFMGNRSGAAWGDFDNDGYPDLYLTNNGANELYHNQGDGTFIEIAEQAGVQGNPYGFDHHASACWWDFDLDGDLDLYISVWRNANDLQFGHNILYENLGDGTFRDISEQSGLNDREATWASLPFDATGDGLPDLYVVNDYGPNHLFANNGDGTFTDMTAAVALEDTGNGMGVAIGDINNDGLFDIYCTNIEGVFWEGDPNKPTYNPLFINNGDGTFSNKTLEYGVAGTGWGWAAEFFDSDHDGDEDLYAVNGFLIEPGENFFFRNMLMEKKRPVLENVSEASGTNGEAEARGMVTFDFDNDGDLDILVANFRESAYLYENTDAPGNWLKIVLEGTEANRSAFGSVVRLTTSDGLTLHRHYDGVDFLGQSMAPVHFGLGAADRISRIVVEWPGGSREVVENIAVNQTITIVQGAGLTTAVNRQEATPPRDFGMLHLFPNPFQSRAGIVFQLERQEEVRISIRDILGRHVRTISAGRLSAGTHTLHWDGKNDRGEAVSNGMYLVHVSVGSRTLTGKLLLQR